MASQQEPRPREDPLVWIDLEMTGLDPDRCHILEIASLITNSELEVLAVGPHLVIRQGEKELETLSDWSRDHFGRSGLLDRVRTSPVSCADAEQATLAFLSPHTTKGKSPLCGNSVHNDRAFLRTRMPALHDHLHYRNVDVSSIKEMIRRWYPERYFPPKKAELHQALADIKESVEELRYYRSAFFVS